MKKRDGDIRKGRMAGNGRTGNERADTEAEAGESGDFASYRYGTGEVFYGNVPTV